MDLHDVWNAFKKGFETKPKDGVGFWVGRDGIFHEDDYRKDEEEFICSCHAGLYNENDGTWIVTPWLYYADCPGVFKTVDSARQMVSFWLKWMERLYGDDVSEPSFEEDWLAIKSNRSLLMILFDQEGETLKKELLKKEKDGEG
jgi:hypothetical protein